MHLVVDARADREILADLDKVYALLDKLPSRIGMSKITPPRVFRHYGTKPADWGISGFVLIAESHIAVHTFPDRGLVNIDVFSCKPFDARDVVDRLVTFFGLRGVKDLVLERGLEVEIGEGKG